MEGAGVSIGDRLFGDSRKKKSIEERVRESPELLGLAEEYEEAKRELEQK